MLKPDCKDCTERYPGCHAKCESFLKYREEYERVKDLQHKDAELERNLYAITRRRKRRKL